MAELSDTSSSGLEPHTILLKERCRIYCHLKLILRFSFIRLCFKMCFVATNSEIEEKNIIRAAAGLFGCCDVACQFSANSRWIV